MIASCSNQIHDAEIKNLDESIVTAIILAMIGWDELFLQDSQITKRWMISKIEGKGVNASPCRLSKAAEEANSTNERIHNL